MCIRDSPDTDLIPPGGQSLRPEAQRLSGAQREIGIAQNRDPLVVTPLRAPPSGQIPQGPVHAHWCGLKSGAGEPEYREMCIRDSVSAEVKSKRFVGIVGPNGSGKSTTLKTIYRVLKPHSGTVLLDGKALEEVSLKESARRLGVMTQMSTLNFDFRVEEVVLMGRTPHKKLMETDNDEDYALAWKALELVGMEGIDVYKRQTIKRALAELIRQGRVEKQARFRESGGITSNCYRIKVGQAELTDELSRT